MKFSARVQFLKHHPAYKKSPVRVSGRLLAWLFLQKIGKSQVVNIHKSSRMRLHPLKNGMGAPGLIYTFREDFEETISYCIHRFVKEGGKCFDIGTNIGIWSLLMSEICGETGRVYSFEPTPLTLKNLRENIELSGKTNITVIPTALGDEKGEVNIYTPADPGRTSMAPETEGDVSNQVPVNRLDEVWEELGRPQISFVKMDVEGAEPLVLAGGGRFFQQCRPVVTSEINNEKLSRMDKKPEDIFRFFREWDYEMFVFDDDSTRLVPAEPRMGGDVVFIPRESKAAV
jgi:FkbM family methyltransferase